jgi:hypothetical protein
MTAPKSFEKEIEAIQPSPVLSSEASSQLDDTYEAYKNESLLVRKRTKGGCIAAIYS